MNVLQRLMPAYLATTQVRGMSTRTAEEFLQDTGVQSVLLKYKLAVHDDVKDANALVALLREFHKLSDKPMPSNAFLKVRSTTDIANYYESMLAPANVQPHVSRLLGTRVAEGEVEEVPRVAATPEAVRERFEKDLPPNLNMDPTTFSPRPIGAMQTGKRLANVPVVTQKDHYENRKKKKYEKRVAKRAAAQ